MIGLPDRVVPKLGKLRLRVLLTFNDEVLPLEMLGNLTVFVVVLPTFFITFVLGFIGLTSD